MGGTENARFDVLEFVEQKYKKAVLAAIERILRYYIDNPIEGELTKEKIKTAGIRSVFFSDDPPKLEYEECDEKGIRCKFTSNLIGVAQGHWMIGHDGARRPLTEKEEQYLTNLENGR